MKIRIFAAGLLLAFTIQAQDIYNFNGLRSEGELTQDFLQTTLEKFNSQLDTLTIKKTSKEGKVTVDFLEQSNFMLDELMYSGDVLVNDEVGAYVNEVMDIILADNPELRSKLRAYITLAPEVNAFANDRGVVLVNLGLFNKLNNEAELASILAHEITHFAEQHNLSSRLKAFEIATDEGGKRMRTIQGFLLRKHAYDRNLEYEADKEGAKRLTKTNYKLSSALDVFTLLSKAQDPFVNELPDYSVLNVGKLDFSSDLYSYFEKMDSLSLEREEEITEWKKENEDGDLYSTHPAVDQRRLEIMETLKGFDLDSGELFLLGEERFKRCQQIARLTQSRLLNNQGQFSEALYHSLALEHDLPNHAYNTQGKITALYKVLAQRNITSSDYDTEKIIAGESGSSPKDDNFYLLNYESLPIQQFKRFLFGLRNFELGLITYAIADSCAQQYPDDLLYGKIKELTILQMIKYQDLSEDGRIVKATIPSSWKSEELKSFWEELKSDDYFIAELQKLLKKEKEREEQFDSYPFVNQAIRGMPAEVINGAKGGIDDLVLVSPFYYTSRWEKRAVKKRFLDSESKEARMLSFIEAAAQKEGMKLQVLDLKHETPSYKELNQLMLLGGVMDQLDLKTQNYPLTADYTEVMKVMEELGSKNIGIYGMVYSERKYGFNSRSLYWLLTPVPFSIAGLSSYGRKVRSLDVVQVVYDLQQGELIWFAYRSYRKLNETDVLIEQDIKHTIHQMSDE